MPKTILQLVKNYKGSYPLLDAMVPSNGEKLRTVVCYLRGKPDGKNSIENLADRCIYLELDKKAVRGTKLSTVRAIAKLIDEESVDLLVCQLRRTITMGVWAAILARRSPRTLGVLHGIVNGRVSGSRRLLNWFIFKRLTKLVCVSKTCANDLITMNWQLDPAKVLAIQNGIDPTPFLEAQNTEAQAEASRQHLFGEQLAGKRLFGTVGRLSEVKNYRRFIESFALASRSVENIGLVIIGSGPLEQELKDLVTLLNINEQVVFLGYRKDITTLLQNIDIFALPSLREGISLALLEAMASGLPVLTSNRGGMKEVVSDSSCGWLIDPECSQSMAEVITLIARETPEQLATIGENARQRVLANFHAERMSSDYEKLYGALLDEH
ncbi:MAG: glycosyltransferase family 4 protein [Gammaproteobacteria bacterium]|nr:glycosyltransferase family 4 protein [Gammaproteobacteria bacterium]MBQ0840982.1 glycosyltransferase family 4 protein [Gammaproteobacteria bacterium]